MSKASNGKVHDKRLHDEEDMAGAIPEDIDIEVDWGFQGLQKQYENIHLPHRKAKGGELSSTPKEENRICQIVCVRKKYLQRKPLLKFNGKTI